MKACIYERLRQDGYDVHRCVPGSDGKCYYLASKRDDRDYGDKDGRNFKAVRETPDGHLQIGATLGFFVSRTARNDAETKGLMGGFDNFVIRAGVAHLRELLQGDLSETLHREIELNSRSPEGAFKPPLEPHPIVEQRDLRSNILRILAEKHSAGEKRVSKDALLENLCTNIDWVDSALKILHDRDLIDGALRGQIKLTSTGHLEAEEAIQPSATTPTYVALSRQEGGAAGEVTATHPFDLFISYASEDRSAVQRLVAILEGRGLSVWWDRGQITLGDKLSEKIDDGLRKSRYGVVIISKFFMAKRWPQSELRSMLNRSISKNEKVILPILLGVTHNEVADSYPLISDIVSTQFNKDLDGLADEILTAIGQGTGTGR